MGTRKTGRSGKRRKTTKRPAAAKRSAATAKRSGRSREAPAVAVKVVLKQGPARGSFGREALQVFEGGVRTALRKMARRGIPVMVKTPQGPVVGVPANRNGVFVIEGEVTRTKRRGSTAKR